MVAPTSVLARQHYDKLRALLATLRAALEQPRHAALAAGPVGHALAQIGDVELLMGDAKVGGGREPFSLQP